MRKTTKGRQIVHVQRLILAGTSIMVNIGSPTRAAEAGSVPYERRNGQSLNRIEFVPFERNVDLPIEKDIENHRKAYWKRINELRPVRGCSSVHPYERWKKTSHPANHSLK